MSKEIKEDLVLFAKGQNVLIIQKDGTVEADLSRVRKLAGRMSLPKLGRFFVSVRPKILDVLNEVDAVTIKRLADRDATRLPIANEDGEPTGKELVVRSTFKSAKVDEEMLEEAQKTFKAEGLPCDLISREKCLVLDDETIEAFGISKKKLGQYGDKIRYITKRASLDKIKKMAKAGGVGGDLINRAIVETTGRTSVYVEGEAKKIMGKPDDLGGIQ